MQGTLRALSKLADEEEVVLLRKLDYIGYDPRDDKFRDQLEVVQNKKHDILVLDELVSQAMLTKIAYSV